MFDFLFDRVFDWEDALFWGALIVFILVCVANDMAADKFKWW